MTPEQINNWCLRTQKMIDTMQEALTRAKDGEDPAVFVTNNRGEPIGKCGPVWNWCDNTSYYNLKPKPKLRPWTTDEALDLIRKEAKVRNKSSGVVYTMACVRLGGKDVHVGLSYTSPYTSTMPEHRGYFTYEDLLNHWELITTDPTPIAKPCGVLI